MNIKKQIRNLYIYEVISGLQIVDVAWVFFLLQRGFSMTQAGVAEGVFHMVSMCCEIPSGMISDLLGRRKTLICSGFLSALSAWCMICTDYFPVILMAMGLNAVSYNLISGTREALTFDSLLQEGMEKEYLKISSRQESIYAGLSGLASLLTVVTVVLGYRIAYCLSIAQGLCCALAASRLKEAKINGEIRSVDTAGKNLIQGLKLHFQKSLSFLRENEIVRRRMIVSGIIGAGGYIVNMLLQEHLIVCGLPEQFIGIPLVFLHMANVLGAMMAEKTGKARLTRLIRAAGTGVGICVCLSGNPNIYLSVLAAMGVYALSELCIVRLENENQKEFSSEIRATMVSVDSMVYSVCMTVLSPVVSALADCTGGAGGFIALGGLVIVVLNLSRRKEM